MDAQRYGDELFAALRARRVVEPLTNREPGHHASTTPITSRAGCWSGAWPTARR